LTGGLQALYALEGKYASSAVVMFQLAAPLAQYPEGVKLLSGADRQYVVAPLMNIVEDSYSPYFDFQQPSEHLAVTAS
jgi:hypothetical protein